MADAERVHTLMANVLVALTVEIDNAYEARAPHATTKGGGSGPWLTSYAMWANLLRLVPQGGVSVRDLAHRAGYATTPHPAQPGMMRWGYITVGPDPQDARAKPPKSALMVRPTPAGERAAGFWAPLAAEVEDRWSERFGRDTVADLRRSLEAVVDRTGTELPAFLPQLDGNLRTAAPESDEVVPGEPSLITALANCLHLLAIDIEPDLPVPLAVAGTVLPAIDGDGTRVRDVGPAAGISSEAVRWSLRVLGSEWVEQIPDPASARGQLVRLSPQGTELRTRYEARLDEIERDRTTQHPEWEVVRTSLDALTADGALLRSGMVPPGRSWRPSEPPAHLPGFPFVLHRGGYPDGS